MTTGTRYYRGDRVTTATGRTGTVVSHHSDGIVWVRVDAREGNQLGGYRLGGMRWFHTASLTPEVLS